MCTSCKELTHWKSPWSWEGLGAGGEGDDRGWDGWMASLPRWTWVWVNSGSWWWTGRPGVLRFMGSQRVGHDWATELNWMCICWASQVALVVKNPPTMRETRVWSWVKKIPWRRKSLPTTVFLPGKSHGQRSLVGYSLQDHKRVRYDLATKQQSNNIIYYLGLIQIFSTCLKNTFLCYLNQN